MNQAKFRGVVHNLGGEDYTIPPLTLAQSEEVEKYLPTLNDPNAKLSERNEIIRQVIGMAIKRNYPNFDVANLKDLLDLANFRPILGSVLHRSGFGPAELKPGEPAALSNGAASMLS